MSGPEFGPGPGFPGAFSGLPRLGSGHSEAVDLRGHRPQHGRGSFMPGRADGWAGSERSMELNMHGPPGEGRGWGNPREPPMMAPRGRGPPMMGEGRARGFGRGADFPPRGGFGRGGFGRAHWTSDGDLEGRGFEGRSWGPNEPPLLGERHDFAPSGGFRGRSDFGRGRGGRFGGGGGRAEFEGRGRRDGWGEEGQRDSDIDPALLERRRESTAALVRRQVAQLQVSRELLGGDEAAETYGRLLDGAGDAPPQLDVRSLHTYPMFAGDGAGAAPAAVAPEEAAPAFERCLLLYQDAALGHSVAPSEQGNFLLPAL